MKKYMKWILILVFIVFVCWVVKMDYANQAYGYGIVNNSGNTPADSLPIPFYALDSAGNIVALASGDSVFFYTFYPNGALAFEDSAAYNGTKITAKTRHGFSVYTWKEAVADIDGTPVQGVYSYILTVKDLTSAALQTPHTGTFQLLTETDFNTSMEYIKDCLDTLQLQDDWVGTSAKQTFIIDTVNAIIDTTQNQDGWVAKEATVQILDDSLDAWDDDIALLVAMRDSIDAILDTLQNQDDWVSSLTEDSNIGIDLDDVTGTLDAGEIGADAITDAKVPAGFWNEGSGNFWGTDITGYTGASAGYDIKNLGAWDPTSTTDTVNAILDTLQNQDDWVAKEATVAEVPDIADTLENQDDWIAKEATSTEILDTLKLHDNWVASEANVTEILDTLKTYDNAGRFQLDIQEVLDTLQVYDDANQLRPEVAAILDTLQNQDNWVAQEAGEIADILDTLQNQDNWVAKEASVTEVLDTLKVYDDAGRFQLDVQEILDTLQVYDNANQLRPEVAATLDTLQNQDGWIAHQTTVDSLGDSLLSYIDSSYAHIDSFFATTFGGGSSNWSNAQRDSVLNYIDSTYAFLDSFFATTFYNWSATQRDSVLDYIDSAYAHGDSFFATTFGGGSSNWSNAQRDSVLDYIDSAYAHLDSFFATTFGVCTGTGSYKDTILTLDGDTNTVEGVSITVRNASGTPVAFGETDVNGIQIFNLDATTYTFSLQRIGIILNRDTTLTVSGNQTDTIWVIAYDPGASPSPDLTCIQGYNGDVGGNTDDRLTITLRPIYGNLIDTSTGIFILHKQHYTYSDTGFFEIYVTPSANLVSKQATGDIDSVRYDLIVYKGYIKQFERRNIFVPIDAGCVWLKDILD